MEIEARFAEYVRGLQGEICAGLEQLDGRATFRTDEWVRAEGGGGTSRVLADGAVFEKAGVNVSVVHGALKPDFAAQLPGDGLDFFACGISLVLHPQNPYVPAVHANFRCLRRGAAIWFGGGADLTPYYPERGDVEHFHRTWKDVCDRHDPTYYRRFKQWCDEYFFLPHRGETRGVGGLFFDQLHTDLERDFAFTTDCGRQFLPAYLPVAERNRDRPYGEREKLFQLRRRGRYAEFNLLYDRGTIFGLKTNGRIESILMSLPPLTRWDYDVTYEPGTPEAGLLDWLRPRAWLADADPATE